MKAIANHKLLITFLLTVFTGILHAQNADSVQWQKKLVFALNFNQASFSSNWKAGGINSVGFNGKFNYQFNYRKGIRTWTNEMDFAYGFVKNSGQGYRKTIDRIFLDTKYGYDLSEKWSLFSSLNASGQFAKGYKYDADGSKQLISDFMAPAFITSAWGFEYHPADYFKVRISPFAPRLTIVKDPRRFTKSVGPQPYGVDSTGTTRFEIFAAQVLAEFNKDVAKNINLKWRYVMYANYNTLQLKTIDHRLDIDITAKVNKFINVGLGAILLYDYDQDSGAQISEVFSFGFLYNFQNYVEPK
jgi:hypothetical protein